MNKNKDHGKIFVLSSNFFKTTSFFQLTWTRDNKISMLRNHMVVVVHKKDVFRVAADTFSLLASTTYSQDT